MKLFGYCGINCAECPAYIATINNDNNKRKNLAELWSKQFGAEFKPESINCYGCIDKEKPKMYYCSDMCNVRKCAVQKNITTCAECDDYNTCKVLNDFIVNVKGAKENLESLRK